MGIRGISALTIKELAEFMAENGINASDVLFHSASLSGTHDMVFYDSSNAAGSVVEGATADDRAVYLEQGVNKPREATQFVAGGQTLTFDAAGGTVTRSAGDFLADGYHKNMELTVAGTASNDGVYLVEEVTALAITIAADADADTYLVEFADEGPLSGGETLDGVQAGYVVEDAMLLHVVLFLPDAGTSLDWSLYTWDSTSEQWTLDTSIGTAGVVSVAAADAANPQRTVVELNSVEKAALVISNSAGVFTLGYSAWLSKA